MILSFRDGPGMSEIIKLLATGSHSQKKNAIDVIEDLVCLHPDAKEKISPVSW